ncbi:mRNA 3 end-processing YTH1 [Fusarium pseudocircinatum]|uniref:mRNA 3 end-processing YTH1 n=1 Tax=Fusarium pseudocircinatum TaxID=56676 RepID=A0A8H5NUA9_9HYPO|nr:mRNA 3 end-processing YTH1 [Fusarium pseudocircinatum]
MRWLVGSIVDWKHLFREAYKCLKPGGYIESYDPSSRIESGDGTVRPGSALSQWEAFFVEGGRKVGRPFTILKENIQREGMREAGFVDIEERDFKNPVGGTLCVNDGVFTRKPRSPIAPSPPMTDPTAIPALAPVLRPAIDGAVDGVDEEDSEEDVEEEADSEAEEVVESLVESQEPKSL